MSEMKTTTRTGHDNDSLHNTDNENRAPKRFVTEFGDGHLDCLDAGLIGRQFSIELINNRTLTGKLRFIGQYDLILTDSRTGQDILVFKHAIVSVYGNLDPEDRR
ncbi:MAG: hypothetical protein QXU18_04900 [Thermoplasmatales archaeon]